MRLVHLADYGGPYAGSFIPMVRAAMRAGRARGWSVEAAFTEVARGRAWLGELEDEGVPVRFAPAGSRRERRAWLERLLDEQQGPVVLHTHFTAFDLPAVDAVRGRARAAVFWHIHSRARREPLVAARNVAKYSVFGRRVAGILCVAPDIAAAVRRRLAPRDRVVLVPNAVDVDRFPLVSPDRRAAARARLGLPASMPVLLHFGWDWERKGGDLFLRAVGALRAAGEPVVAATVAGGKPARALAAELGIADAVRVLEPINDVATLHAAADVFVSASRAEGMPFAMAEALSSGVPVVATDIPGQAAIGRGLGACRLTALDASALAEAIQATLARDPRELAADARAARERIRAEMDLGPWAARLMELYERAL